MRWPDGLKFYPDYLTQQRTERLLDGLYSVIREAPLYRPKMPRTGKPLSVSMTNCGSLGWFTDQAGGYRYVQTHPETGQAWPSIPEPVLDIWRDLANYAAEPEACLINYYEAGAKMGLHRDSDEDALDAPVVSVSLGDDALFRVGGVARRGATRSVRLTSGSVVVMGGTARHCFHGIDRIYPGTSALLNEGGRLNLTLRRVTPPDEALVA